MIIKVCGMRDAQNIREVETLGVDWLGFIFYPRSPRFVSDKPTYLPQRAKRVGVFVNADVPTILLRAKDFGLDLVQLHGSEAPQLCLEVRSALPDVKIIKALSIKDKASLQAAAQYEGVVDYLLFDTHTKDFGGSGQTFDHALLAAYDGQTPFLLSGGLSIDNAEEISNLRHPMLAGYDLNSRFETAPGLKDPALIHLFIETIKPHNHE